VTLRLGLGTWNGQPTIWGDGTFHVHRPACEEGVRMLSLASGMLYVETLRSLKTKSARSQEEEQETFFDMKEYMGNTVRVCLHGADPYCIPKAKCFGESSVRLVYLLTSKPKAGKQAVLENTF